MADITIPGMFLTGVHASRPAANAVGAGALYSCSDHDLIYQSNGSAWSTWATVGGGGGGGALALAGARVVRTSGDVSTSSTSYVDATGLTVTLTTGARRCLVGAALTGYVSAADGHVALTYAIDGTDQQEVLFVSQHATASETMNLSFTRMTGVLSAGSHTIKLRMRAVNAGTATLNANAGQAAEFWVAEQLIEA